MATRVVEHATLSPNEKIQKFADFLTASGIKIESVSKNNDFGTTDFVVENVAEGRITIHAIVKNISSAGWSWKPFVKRIQIKSYAGKNLPLQAKQEIALLGGFAIVDGEYVYAAWNIFAYMSQKTVRSCYIDVDNLIKAHDDGYIKVFYADNHVYLCDSKNMGKLLNAFIKENSVTQI